MRPVGRPGFPNILFSEHSTPPLEVLSQGHGVRSGNRILYAMPAGSFFMSVNPKPSTVCHIPVLTGKGHAGPEEDVGLVPRTVCLWCLLPKWGRIDAAPSGI